MIVFSPKMIVFSPKMIVLPSISMIVCVHPQWLCAPAQWLCSVANDCVLPQMIWFAPTLNEISNLNYCSISYLKWVYELLSFKSLRHTSFYWLCYWLKAFWQKELSSNCFLCIGVSQHFVKDVTCFHFDVVVSREALIPDKNQKCMSF